MISDVNILQEQPMKSEISQTLANISRSSSFSAEDTVVLSVTD